MAKENILIFKHCINPKKYGNFSLCKQLTSFRHCIVKIVWCGANKIFNIRPTDFIKLSIHKFRKYISVSWGTSKIPWLRCYIAIKFSRSYVMGIHKMLFITRLVHAKSHSVYSVSWVCWCVPQTKCFIKNLTELMSDRT